MTNLSYATLSANFARVKDLPVSGVGTLIGGKVEWNIKHIPEYSNACAIRMSYALNYSGLPISYHEGVVSSGKDKKWYFFKVRDLVAFIRQHISSTPLKGKTPNDFKGKKGIIMFTNCGWEDATGHIDLYNGHEVEGDDHAYECGSVELYELK